jgi:hypothetical protein
MERDEIKIYKVIQVPTLLFESHIWVKKTRNVGKNQTVKTLFKQKEGM